VDALIQEEAMPGNAASGDRKQMTPEAAAELERARERMIARHKLIEAMIRNNELQLKNERARGGAEIEHACALRDASAPGAADASRTQLGAATQRLRELEVERDRLVSEREWLNASLLEYENGPSASEHERAGHA
jgi:hypothetical protein